MRLAFDDGDGMLTVDFKKDGQVIATVSFDVGLWLAKVESLTGPYSMLPPEQQKGQWIEKVRGLFEGAGMPASLPNGAFVAKSIVDAMYEEADRLKKKLAPSFPSVESSGATSTAPANGNSPRSPDVPMTSPAIA